MGNKCCRKWKDGKTCHVTYRLSCCCHFTVPARFEVHEQNQTVSLNSSVTLTCAAYGNGPLDLQWYKNGEIYEALENENKYEISAAEGTNPLRKTLTIYQSQRDDTALYSCRAENKHGEDETFIQLFVQGSSSI